MSIFDKITEKATGAAQTAVKKSNDLYEITKTNRDISKEKDAIEKLMLELGQQYYTAYRYIQDENNQFADLCASIKKHEENINLLNSKDEEPNNTIKCTSCGAEMEGDSAFCAKCGNKL